MLNHLFLAVLLIISFYFLGKSADLIILNIREIGEKLGIRMLFLGIILGFLTSFPELFLGINAIINDIPELSFGNLMGGIVVLFGLILGISLILNREIRNDGEITDHVIVSVYIFFPLLMGLDGKLGFVDGLVMIVVYMFLLYIFYIKQKNKNTVKVKITDKNEIIKKFIFIILGLVLLLTVSNFIIKLSILLFEGLNISIFLVGLVVFSLGTNLPELIVTVRSYKRNMGELSISNLAGSAMANVMIVGMFSFIKPIYVAVNISYYVLMFFIAILFLSFLYFYRTNKLLSRNEGYILVAVYFMFLIAQFRLLAFL